MADETPRIPSVTADNVQQALVDLPPDQQAAVMRATIPQLPPSVINAVRTVAGPDQATSDFIWQAVVVTFCAIAFGAAATIALIALGAHLFGNGTSPQIMLTVFTSVVTFLAGLFTPSPVQGRSSGNNTTGSNP